MNNEAISQEIMDENKCEEYIGDYDLKYDEFLGLYYIEKEAE